MTISQAITLKTFYGELVITDTLEITGPVSGDSSGITIGGNDDSRVFRTQSGSDNIVGGPGALANSDLDGRFVVFRCNHSVTDATVSGDVTIGLIGRSGEIAIEPGSELGFEVTMQRSTISGNSTAGNFAVGEGLSMHKIAANLVNSSISGNVISDDNSNKGGIHGGGIYFGAASNEMESKHAKVAYNRATGANSSHKYTPEFADDVTLVRHINGMVQSGLVEAVCGQYDLIKETGFPNSNGPGFVGQTADARRGDQREKSGFHS